MKTKTVIKTISLLLVGIVIGWYVGKRHTVQSNFKLEEIDSINTNIDSISREVDSLLLKIDSLETGKIELVDSLNKIIKEKESNIIKVEKLPLDSSIILLKQFIREYEK